jgi:hypothetical protein
VPLYFNGIQISSGISAKLIVKYQTPLPIGCFGIRKDKGGQNLTLAFGTR